MKTTKAEFELFKKRCYHWQQRLSLNNWAVYFEHMNTKDAYAKTHWSTTQMAATIQFCVNWDKTRPKNDAEIDRLALHEISHILLAPLVSEANWRFTSEDAIDSAEHAIVRALENILVVV